MNIKEAKTEIKNTLLAYHRKDESGNYKYPLVRQRPILLMGPPGIGKTAIMEQVAAECGVGLVAYTITHHTRQSAIGLPRIVSRNYGGREVDITEYTLSEIIASVYDCMERTGKREGILFIDEINCVSETLAPTMLQFLQNKTFGNHRVPEGWMIVAAGNPPEYNKSVREFDIVTLDRVRKIEIQADCQVWMEYAGENSIHRAILSYLGMKRERFYQVETGAEGKAFVTARGWEDLSELLKGYEELELTVTKDQIVQFLQQGDTARDFAAYYGLYCKYGTDYQIPQILAGELSGESYSKKVAMAQRAPFEERFTVISLLLATLDGAFAEYKRMDSYLVSLHGALRQVKMRIEETAGKQRNPAEQSAENRISGMEESCGILRQIIEKRRSSLKVKEEKELIFGEEICREEQVIGSLERCDQTLRREHLREDEKGFERIRELFEQEMLQRRELTERIAKMLRQAFGFVSECFGEEQEMILLVSGLAKSSRAAEFIAAHGCDEYVKYSEILIGHTPEAELRRACREALEE